FSEDIDLTIDHRDLHLTEDPLDVKLSIRTRKRLGEVIERCVEGLLERELVSPLRDRGAALADAMGPVTVVHSGDVIAVHYPEVLPGYTRYLRSEVKLEFGGRNVTDPSHQLPVVTDLAAFFPQVTFPDALVRVLALERTFWEKATLIHAECNRHGLNQDKLSGARMARHWYDLAILADTPQGKTALGQRDLLNSVVAVKQALFYTQGADYPGCLTGDLRLVPAGAHHDVLARDYGEMRQEGLLPEGAPRFAEVLARLSDLERLINQAVTDTSSKNAD
ncbi:MAG: nucleotidyl transferase AbiEii/AbiGii toxin family protein, partial [bacterium]